MCCGASDQLMVKAAAITFDIDWAPDWAIALCDDLCRRAAVKATYFITHQSDILADLRNAKDRVELGIHPNFLPNSSHGDSVGRVLDTCLKIVPEALAVRTHSLMQSTHILGEIADSTRIEVDVSLLLPFHAGLQPTDFYVGESRRRLTRIPYFWEDDVAAEWPGWSWVSDPIATDGLAVYNFHPLFVALNIGTMNPYDEVKEYLSGRFLGGLTESECARFLNHGAGDRTFLESLLRKASHGSFSTISDISRRHRTAG
jgi:hypothetical protein